MLIALAVTLLRRGVPATAHATRHHPLDEQPQLAIDLGDARRSLLQMSREPLHPQVEWLDHV
jgi:hypothetical protein